MDRLVGWLEINYLIDSEQLWWLELEAYGSVRLISPFFLRKVRVVKKSPFGTTEVPIHVQKMYARVEHGGFGFYPCCSEAILLVKLGSTLTSETLGDSFRTLMGPQAYLWSCLGFSPDIFFAKSRVPVCVV